MTERAHRVLRVLAIAGILAAVPLPGSSTQAATPNAWNLSTGLCVTGTPKTLAIQNGTFYIFAAVQSEIVTCGGVYRSLNGGASFTKVGISNPGYSPPRIYDIAASARTSRIYVATDQGIWTTDSTGLVHWTQRLGGLPNFNEIARVSVVSKPGTGADEVYATIDVITNPNGGLWRSTDSGVTWTHVIPNLYVSRVTRALGCSSIEGAEETVVASTWPNMGGIQGGGLWISRDNGSTWAASEAWPTNRANDVAFDCRTGSSNYGHLFVTNADPAPGTKPVYRSLDLGETFVEDFVPPQYSCCAPEIRESSSPTWPFGVGEVTADSGLLRWRYEEPAVGEFWNVGPGNGLPAGSVKSWVRYRGPGGPWGQFIVIVANKVYYYLYVP